MGTSTGLPNLFVIGAARSGTTSLHRYLDQHPAVFMSREKEPNFFAFPDGVPDYRGPAYDPSDRVLHRRMQRALYRQSITRLEDYRALFRDARHPVVGEASVVYMSRPGAAEAIRSRVPEARIVALLRHPVDRAWSKYLQFRALGCEPLDDFEAALRAEEERARANWSPTWLYLRRGLYAEQLQPFFERFDRDRIHVCLFDDFAADPARTVRGIHEFLGLEPHPLPDVRVRYNATADAGRREHRAPGALKSGLARWLPRRLHRELQVLRARLRPAPPPLPPLPERLRAELQRRFRPDLLRLQDLLERDLSSWLR